MEARLEEERERAQHYLDPSTEQHILAVLDEELILRHMETVVAMENSGVVHMLQTQKYEDLECMYRLLRRVDNGVKVIVQTLNVHLKERGRSLVMGEEEGVSGEGGPGGKTATAYVQVCWVVDVPIMSIVYCIYSICTMCVLCIVCVCARVFVCIYMHSIHYACNVITWVIHIYIYIYIYTCIPPVSAASLQGLLELRGQYDLYLQRSFHNDILFRQAMSAVREHVVCYFLSQMYLFCCF